MKKVLVILALAFALSAMAQGSSQLNQSAFMAKGALLLVDAQGAQPSQQPAPSTQQPAQQPGQQGGQGDSGQIIIKDQGEFNAYMVALNTQDPAAKAAAMESFLQQYPSSVVKTQALEQAMSAYTAAGNQPKVQATAKRILADDPNNVRALAIVTFLDRVAAVQPGAQPAVLKEACDFAQKGLQSLPAFKKTQGVSDAEFEKTRNQATEIFNGTQGFCLLQSKDYANAKSYYQKAIETDPSNMQDVYQMAIADLESNPMDINGFWYIAKATNLAKAQNNAQAAQGIEAYGKAKYKKYSGATDGWDQIVAGAANENAPPADFASRVPKALTPAELAVKAVKDNPPDSLSFSDWEFILGFRDASPANKDAADQVWAAIQAKEKNGQAKLSIPAKVVQATKESLDVAISDDNQAANKADMHVVLDKPLVKLPAVGSTTNVIGVITSYTPQPFMFTMEKAELPAPKPPVRPTRGGTKKKKK